MQKKTTPRKITLSRETLRTLDTTDLQQAAGAMPPPDPTLETRCFVCY